MENETPWWLNRCTHNQHLPDVCWKVLKEAEGAVVLALTCMDRGALMPIHVLVELSGVGSSCQPITFQEYKALSESGIMALVQSQFRELKSLNSMP